MWIIAKGLTVNIAVDRLIDLLPLLAITVFGVALLEITVYLFFSKVLRSQYTLPYTLVAPAALALLLFTVYPFVYNVRLAFSDLRLKTFSCYIPNEEITNVPCSLSQAAPNADVKIDVDQIEARVEPVETADVAFVLNQGDEVHVTGRSSKNPNYIVYSGFPMRIEDGVPTNRPCGADPICVRAFNTYKAEVIDTQDERDWWPVERDGQQGWIPNNVFYVSADSPLYSASTGGEVQDASVTAGQEARLIIHASSQWYELNVDDSTGWIPAEMVVVSETFTPTAEAPVYADMSDQSESAGQLSAGQEASLTNTKTMTWYNIVSTTTAEGEVPLEGWIRIENQDITSQEVFTLSTDADVFEAIVTEGEGTATGSIPAATDVILLTTDAETTDTTWYQVSTLDGSLTGWVSGITPTNNTEVEFFSTSAASDVHSEASLDSDVVGALDEGTRVRLKDHDTSNDTTWYNVRLGDVNGWTNAEGTAATNFKAAEDSDVYQNMGGTGEVVMSVAQNDLLSVANSEPQEYTRYQVRAADGSIGWLEAEPNEDATTHRDPVLYSFDYGWDNFKRVFVKTDPQTGDVEDWGRLLQTQNSTFPRLMRTTVAWTSLNVIFHLVFGMILALLLNRPGLKLRGIYRAIIILPWAIPQPIIALAWKGEFHYQYGFVNTILREIGVNPINWLYTPAPAFAAVTFVNIWLGIPFYMVTLLGGLQSIAGEYYEAAEIDGANAWQKFRNVTVPLIRPVAVPIITLDVIWTFNNFNVIYLITKGEPNETSNILVTALYNAAFGENGQTQLGFAAAFSLVIFLVLFLFASVWVTSSGALKGVYES